MLAPSTPANFPVFDHPDYGQTTFRSADDIAAIIVDFHSRKQNQIRFSEKEIDFIKFLCQELTLKEIASKMHLSIRSVEDYCKRIKEKTNTVSMVGIALFAVKNSIFSFDGKVV